MLLVCLLLLDFFLFQVLVHALGEHGRDRVHIGFGFDGLFACEVHFGHGVDLLAQLCKLRVDCVQGELVFQQSVVD